MFHGLDLLLSQRDVINLHGENSPLKCEEPVPTAEEYGAHSYGPISVARVLPVAIFFLPDFSKVFKQ